MARLWCVCVCVCVSTRVCVCVCVGGWVSKTYHVDMLFYFSIYCPLKTGQFPIQAVDVTVKPL